MEKDDFCKKVIRARVLEGHFKSTNLPIYNDVETVSFAELDSKDEDIDGLGGGWPCQAGPVCEFHYFIILAIHHSSVVLISRPGLLSCRAEEGDG